MYLGLFSIIISACLIRSSDATALNGNLETGEHIRALACSCLLALSVAGGSSPHLLRAMAAILMSPRFFLLYYYSSHLTVHFVKVSVSKILLFIHMYR